MTIAQITAIILLLQAFSVDPATIDKVRAQLEIAPVTAKTAIVAPIVKETPVCTLDARVVAWDLLGNPQSVQLSWLPQSADGQVSFPASFGGNTFTTINGKQVWANWKVALKGDMFLTATTSKNIQYREVYKYTANGATCYAETVNEKQL